MSNEVIIDGVNVAECIELQKVVNEEPYCDSSKTTKLTCKGNNCYFKQLQRAKAENEKLKKDIHNIYENCKYCDEFYMDKCNYIKKENKYKQALEEAREWLLKWQFNANIIKHTNEPLNKINEVLND